MSATTAATRLALRRPVFGRLQPLLPDAGAIALLLGLTLLFFWRLITPNAANRMSFQDGDFVEQFYAFASFRAHELAAGRLPGWNPYVFGGHPFIADVQSAVYYPVSWLTNLVGIPRGFPFIALELEAIGHYFLASLFGYLLGRRLVRNVWASLTVGIVYAFGGYLTSYPSQQLSLLEVHTWLPLVILGVHLATERGRGTADRVFWAVGTGLTFGVSTLGGHPQSSAYVFYGSFAYWLFRVACLGRDGDLVKRPRLAGALATVLYLPVGGLIAAAQLLPTAEFISLSTRAELGYDFTWWGFPLQDILQVLVPGSVSVYSPMYVGVLPLVLAIGAAIWYRSRQVAFWTGLAVIALAVSFGGHTFIYSVLYNLAPGFASFRDHERSIVLFTLSGAVLSGYGMLLLLHLAPAERVRAVWRLQPTVVVGIGLVLAGYALLIIFALSRIAGGRLDELSGKIAFLVLNLAFVTGLLVLRRIRSGQWRIADVDHSGRLLLGILACALVVFDLFSVNWKNNLVSISPRDRYRSTPITTTLQNRIGEWRAHNEFQLPLNYGDVYRIEDTGGASPLQIARYEELRKALPRERFFELLGVRYLITWEGGPPGGNRLAEYRPEPEKDPDKVVYLYELPEPPARFRLIGEQIIADDAAALAALSSKDFDPARQVVLPRPAPVALAGAPTGNVAVLDRLPGRFALQVESDRPAVLAMAEVFYPGWKATIDGTPAEVLRANYTLRAVAVPAGQHRVDLVFDSTAIKAGIAISLLTLLLAAGTLVATLLSVRRSATGSLLRRPSD